MIESQTPGSPGDTRQAAIAQWSRQQDVVRRQLESWLPSFGSQAALLSSLHGRYTTIEGARSHEQLEALFPDMLEDTARMAEALQALHRSLQAYQAAKATEGASC